MPLIYLCTLKEFPISRLFFVVVLIILFFLPALGVIGIYYYFSYDLPRIESLRDYRPPLVSEVYAARGELIGEFFIEKRYLVQLSDVAPIFIHALLAAEDAQFFEHKGINLWSIVRAAFKNISSFEIRQGGSTITQQIVKSLLLTPEKTLSRKIKEAILATRIEQYLPKEDILTLYLNQIYFGRGAYGVEAAARNYFGKSARDLTLAEAAFLAGLPKAPSYYQDVKKALERRAYVLGRMAELGFIQEQERQKAEHEPLRLVEHAATSVAQAPYFLDYIKREIEKKYGAERLYNEGFRIETTLDLSMQKAAEAAVARGVADYDRRTGKKQPSEVQAALISLAPFSGHIKAMVGGKDYRQSQFNRAVQAQRQPGSAFKPIIYAAAIDKGYTPASIIVDSPFIVQRGEPCTFWEPQNYDRTFQGPTTLRKALTYSRNVVTVKIMKNIGIDHVLQYTKKLGIEGDIAAHLSLSLGTCSVSLLTMVRAYAVFCNLGSSIEPLAILRIIDRDGTVLEENPPRLSSAISPETAYIMTSMLQSVVEEGTGKKVRALNRPCAGKTGTTNDVRDAWFIGFTPRLVTGVWVGFDDMSPLGKHETGAVAASPIWLDFMQTACEGEPVQSFSVPDGIVFVKINPATGLPPRSVGEDAVFECFKEGNLPTDTPFGGENNIDETVEQDVQETMREPVVPD
ncbi:MAG: PBP1A family penicillin-binding protein [Desulfobacterota bacterium]|nr:PBP1A family penicillin-binding protein [Thermodesulfobacteriota bacterium]